MKKMNIFQKVGIFIAIVIALCMGVFVVKPYADYKANVCNADLSTYNTKGLTYDQLGNVLRENIIYNVDELYLNDVITYDFSHVEEQMKAITFSQYLKQDYSLINLNPVCNVDKEQLSKVIDDYNASREPSVNASWELVDGVFTVIPETIGTRIDKEKFTEFLLNHIEEYTYLNEETTMLSFYEQPEITSEFLKPIVEQANCHAEWYVEYENGKRYTVDDVAKRITINDEYNIVLDYSFIETIVKDVASMYNSVGAGVNFKTTAGDDVVVKGGTWGRLVSEKDEYDFLTYAFEHCESWTEIEPAWGTYREEIGDTYVEVSKDAQHVWVYEKGELVLESDCVTGTKGVHDTPTGAYFISECIDGKYLRGADYKTWVNKWMRITNRGHGLHDAYWRDAFGGTIYQSSGSHGCINLPPKVASKLYDLAYVGMPVIIY